MVNLAGVQNCDETIENELKIAGITIVKVNRMNSEVPASIIGKLNGFTFKRAWYYWMVDGLMPLEYAKELYAKYKAYNIRAAGHCGNPPPEEWCEPRNYDQDCKPITERARKKKITWEEADKLCNDVRSQGEQFVKCYHIDTQQGLNYFVEMIKNNNISGN